MFKTKSGLVLGMVLILLFTALFASQSLFAQDKIVLDAISAWPESSPEHAGYWYFMEKVEEELGDRVEINYLGGPEVIGTLDQFEMLGQGAFDIMETAPNYSQNNFPLAIAVNLSELTPWEEREVGAYDILREEYEEQMNLVYLGQTGSAPNYVYQFFTNFEINSLDDFKNKTIRVSNIHIPVLKELGASPVTMAPGEIYTAMERGVVDGFGWSSLGLTDFGWGEVTDYIIEPGFNPCRIALYFNRDTWYSLPEDIRVELEEIVKEVEKDMYKEFARLNQEEKKALLAKGMEIIELPPDVKEEFVSIAHEVGWEEVINRAPEKGKKLKELLTE